MFTLFLNIYFESLFAFIITNCVNTCMSFFTPPFLYLFLGDRTYKVHYIYIAYLKEIQKLLCCNDKCIVLYCIICLSIAHNNSKKSYTLQKLIFNVEHESQKIPSNILSLVPLLVA